MRHSTVIFTLHTCNRSKPRGTYTGRSSLLVKQGKVRYSVPITGPVVAQRVGRGIAVLFHDRGTRRGWVVSSTSRPSFTPGKGPVPIVQEAGWAPGPVWPGENLAPPGFDPRTVQSVAQSLYRLSYPARCFSIGTENFFAVSTKLRDI